MSIIFIVSDSSGVINLVVGLLVVDADVGLAKLLV